MMSRSIAGALAGLLVVGTASPASHAEATVELGDLTCTLTNGASDTASSQSRNLVCSFRPAGSGVEEIYHGTLNARADQPLDKSLLWVVRGPSTRQDIVGMLNQKFTAVVPDGGQTQRLLVGEDPQPIALLPLEPQRSQDSPVTDISLSFKAGPA